MEEDVNSLARGSSKTQPRDQLLKSLKAGRRMAGTLPSTQQLLGLGCNIPKFSMEDGLDIITTGSNAAQSGDQELKSLKAGWRMAGLQLLMEQRCNVSKPCMEDGWGSNNKFRPEIFGERCEQC